MFGYIVGCRASCWRVARRGRNFKRHPRYPQRSLVNPTSTSYASISQHSPINSNRPSSCRHSSTKSSWNPCQISSCSRSCRTSTTSTIPPSSEPLTQILSDCKKLVQGQWSPVQEEWASERKWLTFARDEWENKVKTVETDLGTTAAKFEPGEASLAVVQRQLQRTQSLFETYDWVVGARQ